MLAAEFICSSAPERLARRQGYRVIAGVDEAGRGCLFGPVFAAAVVLNPERPVRGLNDSKLLPPDVRETLSISIRRTAIAWAVGVASSEEIDAINILQASRLAMRRAVEALTHAPDFLLIDHVSIDLPLRQRSITHGDALSRSIAAASILAKTSRDANMLEWDAMYPQYGFVRNKGYGAPEHLRALDAYGPTPQHRRTFSPVRQRAEA